MAIDLKIREAIERQGYITVDELMRFAMSFEAGSYYQSTNLLGEGGDFTTSPEVSQIFGEMIGLWAIDQWQRLGSPKEINLVELGPGRGLLMRDLLRTAVLDQQFYQAISGIELVEINPYFQEWQKNNLESFGLKITWHQVLDKILKKPTIFIANEFFDALPIKQYLKVKELWYELNLIVDPSDGKIKFDKIAVPKILQEQFLNDYREAYDGAVLEESNESLQIARFIGSHLFAHGGAGLIIDYGYDINPKNRLRSEFNSTLQAVKEHRYHSILDNLGEADLSAHVDFYALSKTLKSRNIEVKPTISQRDFLLQYGIELRKNLLMQGLSKKDKPIIERQVSRLIDENQMGNLFRVLKFNSSIVKGLLK